MARPGPVHPYRRTGADLPWGDPRRAHGVAMEGYYWRFTDVAAGRVVVALCGVCEDWAMVALAAHPGGFVRVATVPGARADSRALGVRAGTALVAAGDELAVDLGPGATLRARLTDAVGWPRAWGALGPAHAVPGLGQYWHPHVLGATVEGEARLGGDDDVSLAAATAYAEKNWGSAFSSEWWWGQAHGFAEPEACVAFAGGPLRLAGWRWAPSAVVLRLGGELIVLRPPLARVAAEVGSHGWRLRARSAGWALELEGTDAGAPAARLPVPLPGTDRELDWRSHHVLAGALRVELLRGRRVRWAGESALAGLEAGGPQTLR
jgi:Tocopherol cyclase